MEAVSATAVPCLLVAYGLVRAITSAIQDVKMSRYQLQSLGDATKVLLETLNNEYKAGRLSESTTSVALEDLNKVLRDICVFVEKQVACGFLRSLLNKNERLAKIESHHRKLVFAVQAFNVVSLVNIQYWQRQNDAARSSDQLSLHKNLEELKVNQQALLETMAARRENLDAMIVSIHRHLTQNTNQDVETKFLRETIRYMETASGRIIPIKKWTITSFDVEFEEKLTSGGFGDVWRGSWHGTQVALKMLKKDGSIRGTDPTREIEVWSTLAHPHILEFFGANVLDDKPFIVMPYYRNGNARDYIQRNPDCDRIKILYDISLGLVYLHSQRVTHGDLKAMNVLIGEGEKAVLCDFGLSEVGKNATSRATGDVIIGSRFWMSPERLEGMWPEPPSDVYAFGMTTFEIYTNETPLTDISMMEFIECVAKGSRPKRPQGDKKSVIPDEIWDLAVKSWAHEPSARPTANAIRDEVNYILQLASVEKREAQQEKLRDEVGILQQDIIKLRQSERAKGQELEQLRGNLQEINIKRAQEVQEAHHQGQLKDLELLQLRADFSSVTQTHNQCMQTAYEARLKGEAKDQELQHLREELLTMKKRLDKAEEALRQSDARCQELQKSQDLLSSIAGVLSSRIHEAQLARRQAEVKDQEVQEIQQQFLSFAGKHSSDIQEAKPEENTRPAEMDTIPDPQRELDSDRQDRDPNMQPSKSPLIPHPPKSIPEGFESPIDGHQTIGLHEKLRKNVDDGSKPPVLLPHSADSLWHLNPWDDNHGHEGPSEDKSRDQLAVAKAAPEPPPPTDPGTDGDTRHLPSQHKVENIQRKDEPQVGATGYAQNLSVGHPTADEEDQAEVWDNVVPLLAPTPPKTFKRLAEVGKPNTNDVHSELEGLQFDLPQLPLEPYQEAIIPKPTRPSVESPVRLPTPVRLSQPHAPSSDANATLPSLKTLSQPPSNQNPVIPVSLSRSSPYIRPRSIPPSGDPPIPNKPSTPTLSSSLPTPSAMTHPMTTISATSSFTQPQTTPLSQLRVLFSDASSALPSSPNTSLQGSPNQGPVMPTSLSQSSHYVRTQTVPPSDDPPISVKPSTRAHSASVPPRPMTADPTTTRNVTAGSTQSSAGLLSQSHVPSSDLSAVHTSSFQASSHRPSNLDPALSHSSVWSSHVPSQRSSSSSDTPIPTKPSTSTPSSAVTSLPTAANPTGTKDATAAFVQSTPALRHAPSSDASAALPKLSSQGYSNQAVSLPRQSSAFASLQANPSTRFLQSSQHVASGTGALGSSGSGSWRNSTPHAPMMRQAQTEPHPNYKFQSPPLTGVGSSFTDSPLTTFSRPIDPSDDESSSPLPNVTLTPSKPTSTDRGAYSYSQALPTTGFKEEAGLDEGRWRK